MDEEPQVMQESIKQMRYQQIWPKKNSKHFRLQCFVAVAFSFPVVLANFAHMFAAVRGLDELYADLSEDIAVTSAAIGCYLMLCSFVWRQKEIEGLWKKLGPSEAFGGADNFAKRRRQLNLMSKLYAYYCYVSLILYLGLRIYRGSECEKLNLELGLNEVCGMMTPAWAPFDIKSTPMKQIFLVFQLYGAYFLCKGAASISTTTFEVSEYIVLKIKHLRKLIEAMFDDPREDIQRRNLIFCIKYHQHIIGLQKLFDSYYKHCNGCYVLMVGIIFASVSNQFLKQKDVGPLMHLGGWLIAFFISCYSGQSVITESLKIPESVFGAKWYDVSVPLRKDVLLILLKSQQAFYLHATPIGIMSLGFFVAIVKTSYSYFTLLRQTT